MTTKLTPEQEKTWGETEKLVEHFMLETADWDRNHVITTITTAYLVFFKTIDGFNDLEKTREILDDVKSVILDDLSKSGWE